MEVILLQSTSTLFKTMQRQTVAIGQFDGVHMGHRYVINAAKKDDCLLTVMTFDPSPRTYFAKTDTTAITPLTEKLRRLANIGVDIVYVVQFDDAFAQQTPLQFMQWLQRLGFVYYSVGFDFRFGAQAAGDVALLQTFFQADVTVAQPLLFDNEKVSSTRIRQCLQLGDVQTAHQLLQDAYRWTGIVTHGKKLGRTIGFPTANIDLDAAYEPLAYGVYDVDVLLANGDTYQGVMNIGLRPTVTNELKETREVHILNFNADVYDQRLTIVFHRYLRPEHKFNGLDALVAQINQDVANALTRTVSTIV